MIIDSILVHTPKRHNYLIDEYCSMMIIMEPWLAPARSNMIDDSWLAVKEVAAMIIMMDRSPTQL